MNRINEFIEKQTNEAIRFAPTKRFYGLVKISQKRFGQLLRNEKEATYGELQRISEYFNVPINDLVAKS